MVENQITGPIYINTVVQKTKKCRKWKSSKLFWCQDYKGLKRVDYDKFSKRIMGKKQTFLFQIIITKKLVLKIYLLLMEEKSVK